MKDLGKNGEITLGFQCGTLTWDQESSPLVLMLSVTALVNATHPNC